MAWSLRFTDLVMQWRSSPHSKCYNAPTSMYTVIDGSEYLCMTISTIKKHDPSGSRNSCYANHAMIEIQNIHTLNGSLGGYKSNSLFTKRGSSNWLPKTLHTSTQYFSSSEDTYFHVRGSWPAPHLCSRPKRCSLSHMFLTGSIRSIQTIVAENPHHSDINKYLTTLENVELLMPNMKIRIEMLHSQTNLYIPKRIESVYF